LVLLVLLLLLLVCIFMQAYISIHLLFCVRMIQRLLLLLVVVNKWVCHRETPLVLLLLRSLGVRSKGRHLHLLLLIVLLLQGVLLLRILGLLLLLVLAVVGIIPPLLLLVGLWVAPTLLLLLLIRPLMCFLVSTAVLRVLLLSLIRLLWVCMVLLRPYVGMMLGVPVAGTGNMAAGSTHQAQTTLIMVSRHTSC
jgi:hypothetical protein